MQKIISLFQRNYDTDRLVRDEVTPGAEWVTAGEGRATVKWDGTCCMIRGGRLFKRYEVKPGKQPPADFEPANDVDEVTGKQQGWLPVGDGPEDQWYREAFGRLDDPSDGTYELIGPKVQGNAERWHEHMLMPHGLVGFTTQTRSANAPVVVDILQHHKHQDGTWTTTLPLDPPRDFNGLKQWLATQDVEGIVWHHPDGRMVKIKGRDFGLKRPK